MGKKQHSKDRMYITTTEWAQEWGGAKNRDLRIPFQKLPFYCCSLSFAPFEHPVVTAEGHVFELLNIIPYIQKFGKNPVTGQQLAAKDLITLHFHKNSEGQYECPVLNKVFTEFTHIVAVKTTGNVFCYEAVRELNIKAKNWRELLTDEPFTREDILTLQDPARLDAKVLTEFDHIKKDHRLDDEELKKAQSDPSYFMTLSADAKRMLQDIAANKGSDELRLGGGGGKAREERGLALAALDARKKRAAEREANGQEAEVEEKEKPIPLSVVDAASASIHGRSAAAAKAGAADKTHARVAAHAAGDRVPIAANSKMVRSKYTSGQMSRGFTSTTFTPVTVNEYAMVRVEKNPKKKGYARLHTSLGDLNLELHCDLVPRTCENFLTHAEAGYYNNTVFHRCIRNFMIQGGDPTGTGRGGESIWGKPFNDEVTSKLGHSERGVVSMANSGPHSNNSQFFILFKSAPHLNYKHAVFAKLVGGLDQLAKMEKVAVDKEDRPLEPITLLKITVFVNPFTEPDEEELAEKAAAELDPEAEAEKERVGSWYSNPGQATTSGLAGNGRSGVGKYMRAQPQAAAGTAQVRATQRSDDDGSRPAGIERGGGVRRSLVEEDGDVAPVAKRLKEEGVQRRGVTTFGDFSGW
eukprot:TRINITY_DN2800_c0_g3_i1.p1 TRINITY_DN2800_c0_g3~~TRINITY_DN2800_c0_g3_i1.p1  ORF type:complete len:638 (+),score=168.47 TRINITY_DN2800_c0_g3_i1:54-1967(+)